MKCWIDTVNNEVIELDDDEEHFHVIIKHDERLSHNDHDTPFLWVIKDAIKLGYVRVLDIAYGMITTQCICHGNCNNERYIAFEGLDRHLVYCQTFLMERLKNNSRRYEYVYFNGDMFELEKFLTIRSIHRRAA